MAISRRLFLSGLAATGTVALSPRHSLAVAPGRALPIPPLTDAVRDPVILEAIAGRTAFLDGATTPTLGFSQSYLGPTLRMRRGEIARVAVRNRLDFPVTCHWHGLHVPAISDGGPQLEIAPAATWRPELAIDQPAATLWYHSHVHGRTGEQVHHGLAGLILIDDPSAPDPGLPNRYGVDDLPLILQDRAFEADGAFRYVTGGPTTMLGFRAGTMLVNGAVRPVASPPASLTRLRLLNASNARIYHLRFADGRSFHQVASDGGLLKKPRALTTLTLAPAERVEVLVDFSDARTVTLLSGADDNSPMGGMGGGRGMGGGMRAMMAGMLPAGPPQAADGQPGEFEIMAFEPDRTKTSSAASVPDNFAGAPDPDLGEPVRTRSFSLEMHAAGGGGRGGMGRGMGGGGMMGAMGINGRAFALDRIDITMRRGETERWVIRAAEMAHPFHIHGTAFRLLSVNGHTASFDETGLKDVVLVTGETELLVRVDHPATNDVPFMFHCHILEHEDAGMMGQFSVS